MDFRRRRKKERGRLNPPLSLLRRRMRAYLYLLTFLDTAGKVADGHVLLKIPERDDPLLIANQQLVPVGGAERETADAAQVVPGRRLDPGKRQTQRERETERFKEYTV